MFPEFEDFFSHTPLQRHSQMQLDLSESDTAYVAKVNVPGVPKDNIEIEFKNNILTVRAHHGREREGHGENDRFHFTERVLGEVTRSVAFPRGTVNTETIGAVVADGVLTVTLPKVQPTTRHDDGVKITVQ
jgi:HSP20 family protein